jgi:hypothetical protein
MLVASAAVPNVGPDLGNLPGSAELLRLLGGLEGWGLALSLAALIVGAVTWAFGAHSQNYHHAYLGRRVVLVSGLAALLIGAGPGLVQFFFDAGQQVH